MAKKAAALSKVEKRYCSLAKLAGRVCDDKRAEEVAVLDVRSICDYADFFVIATAASQQQLRGIAKELEKNLAEEAVRPLSRQGIASGKWTLLDYGDLVIHLFDPESRRFYQLDELWGDGQPVKWRK